MLKKYFCILLLFLLHFAVFSAIHDNEQFELVLRTGGGYTDCVQLLSNKFLPDNPAGIFVLPLSFQGQLLFLYKAFCIGVETGLTGCNAAAGYLLPCALLLGWTDMLTVKIGYGLPVSPLYKFNLTDKTFIRTTLITGLPNYLSLELGLITLYYNKLMFNLFLELTSLVTADNGSAVSFITLGVRTGKKPKNRGMINLGLAGISVSFF